ncbi:MAG TPA: cold shock domain-containing protein [Candidatus Omnitrophota bacterium]|jgi:CspA family cold shock protein|nr:cold shock domain-containing protein [Candidatus Omnitrophota bacterium]HRZ15411.1 cold shock domain-containing protein [Candidatus Omnitrophota bacterium]
MHTGKIKKLVRDRGFGFISDTDGREVFFHQSSLVEVRMEALNEEQAVEFDVENSPKGPRAVNIKIATAAA